MGGHGPNIFPLFSLCILILETLVEEIEGVVIDTTSIREQDLGRGKRKKFRNRHTFEERPCFTAAVGRNISFLGLFELCQKISSNLYVSRDRHKNLFISDPNVMRDVKTRSYSYSTFTVLTCVHLQGK